MALMITGPVVFALAAIVVTMLVLRGQGGQQRTGAGTLAGDDRTRIAAGAQHLQMVRLTGSRSATRDTRIAAGAQHLQTVRLTDDGSRSATIAAADLDEVVRLTDDGSRSTTSECNAKLVGHARVTQFPCKEGHYHDFDHRGSNVFSARGRCIICHLLFTYHMETSKLKVWRPRSPGSKQYEGDSRKQ